jgi:hypothetical protein
VLLKKSIKQLYVRFIAHVLEQVLTNVWSNKLNAQYFVCPSTALRMLVAELHT